MDQTGLIRTISHDLGPMVRLSCPRCEQVMWFVLKHHRTGLLLIAFMLPLGTAFSLHCANCDHEIDVPDSEREKAIAFLPTACAYADGEMEEDMFLAKLKDANFAFLRGYANASVNWTCPKCGEGSPLTFTACWSCGAARESATEADVEEPPRTSHLDNAMKDGDRTFGSLKL